MCGGGGGGGGVCGGLGWGWVGGGAGYQPDRLAGGHGHGAGPPGRQALEGEVILHRSACCTHWAVLRHQQQRRRQGHAADSADGTLCQVGPSTHPTWKAPPPWRSTARPSSPRCSSSCRVPRPAAATTQNNFGQRCQQKWKTSMNSQCSCQRNTALHARREAQGRRRLRQTFISAKSGLKLMAAFTTRESRSSPAAQ